MALSVAVPVNDASEHVAGGVGRTGSTRDRLLFQKGKDAEAARSSSKLIAAPEALPRARGRLALGGAEAGRRGRLRAPQGGDALAAHTGTRGWHVCACQAGTAGAGTKGISQKGEEEVVLL